MVVYLDAATRLLHRWIKLVLLLNPLIQLLLEIISGSDNYDSTVSKNKVPKFLDLINQEKSLEGLKIGLPKEYFIDGMDEQVRKSVLNAVNVLKITEQK